MAGKKKVKKRNTEESVPSELVSHGKMPAFIDRCSNSVDTFQFVGGFIEKSAGLQ